MATPEFHRLPCGLWAWQNYDPAVKTDLFSSAVLTDPGLYFVDPIPLADDQLQQLSRAGSPVGIIVTNANHHRAASLYSDRFSIPIFGHPDAFPEARPSRLNLITGDALIGANLEVIEIEGAAAGEIALYKQSDGGTLIIGDALINFEPYGFAFLPSKYCQNQKQMRKSLAQLLTRPAERMLFAHGTPILSNATSRLRQLLEAK